MKLHFRRRQMKLVGGLNVGGFAEHGHQFRQIVEIRKAVPYPVASFRP